MTEREKLLLFARLRALNERAEAAAEKLDAAIAARDAALRRAVADGMTQTEVASAAGLGRQRVSQILAKAAS